MKITKLLELREERRQRKRKGLQLFGLLICFAMLTPTAIAVSDQKAKGKEEMGPVIGIDLGTTYSAVGIYKNGKTEIIPNELGNRITPSVVAFTDEDRLVGEAAKNQASGNPLNTIFTVKRLIGRQFNDPEVKQDRKWMPFEVVSKHGKPYPNVQMPGESSKKAISPEEVSSMILTKMKTIAEKYVGEDVKHAVITVPAYFNDAQRQATKDAAAIAGLDVLRILNEPTAAAIAYGLDKKGEKNVLVFDLGGGTFDVSLLTLEDGVFEVLSTAGDTHLGGEDFDQRLTQYFVKEVQKKHGVDLTKDPRSLQKLKGEVERAKRDLSSNISAKLSIPGLINGEDFEETITRARFEQLCADLFKKTLEPVKKVLSDSETKKSQIDEIVLVGGSTRIPKVQSLIKEFFNGKEPNRGINPDEAVAYGAAVQACVISGNCGDSVDNIVVLDVTPLSLGIETVGRVMSTIVKRGTMVPTEKTQVFTTNEDNQTQVDIAVFEGERALTKDNHRLGRFELTGIPPAPRGTAQIEVIFKVDEAGILSVFARDKASKSENSIEIKNQKGRLTEQEIKDLVDKSKEFEEADKLVREKVDARNQLESYTHSIKNQVSDKEKLADKLSEEEKQQILDAVKETNDWLSKNDYHSDETTKEDFEEQLKQLQDVCNPIIQKVYKQSGTGGQSQANNDEDFEEM